MAWLAAATIQLSYAQEKGTVVVTADRMLDVIAGRMVDHPQIVITDGRITSVGAQGGEIPAAARRIDLPGMTLLPGLIDMHVHITCDPHYSGYRRAGVHRQLLDGGGRGQRQAHPRGGLYHRPQCGLATTTMTSPSSRGSSSGYIPGPRIVPATYAIGATGGHCDYTEFPPSITAPSPAVANGPERSGPPCASFASMAPRSSNSAARAVYCRKPTPSGAQQYGLVEMKALVDEAHMLGLRVAVHAHGTAGIKDAIRAGVDTIEHASLADEEAFALAKQHGT